jgi:predicted transcriptional regulator
MRLVEIAEDLGTTRQNISQTASRAIKKLFKNAKKTYKLSHTDTLDMLVTGLGLYEDEKDAAYFFKCLDKKDKEILMAENQ